MHYDIFIAYSSQDRALADSLYDALHAVGERVFLDHRSVRLGDDWAPAILHALNSALVVIVLLTTRSGQSFFVQEEVNIALRQAIEAPGRKRVIPVFVDDVDPPYGLSGKQGVRFDGDWNALVDSVRGAPPTAYPSISIAVLGNPADCGAELTMIRSEVQRRLGNTVLSNEGGTAVDLSIVILGTRIEPTVRRALERAGRTDHWVFKTAQLDETASDEEIAQAIPIRRRVAESVPSRSAFANRVDAWLSAKFRPALGREGHLLEWERRYLEGRSELWRIGRSLMRASARLERAALYVSLGGDLTPGDAGDRRWHPGGAAVHEADIHGTAERAMSKETRTIVEGGPGAGKSSLFFHVAYVLACASLEWTVPSHDLQLENLRGPLPVPVPITFEARALTRCGGTGGYGELIEAAAREIEDVTATKVDRERLRVGLEHGRYMLLVDSLDEVPGEESRQSVYLSVCAAPATVRVHLSTRPVPLSGMTLSLPTIRLAQLGPGEVSAMVDRWMQAQGRGSEYASELSSAVRGLAERYFDERGGHAQIDRNPLLLTAAFLVHLDSGRLPNSTADLYDRMVDILCRSRLGDARQRRAWLEQIALRFQEEGVTVLREEDVARALAGQSDMDAQEAREHLSALANQTGLLRAELDGVRRAWRFWHRSFQEFLCAFGLVRRMRDPDSLLQTLTARFNDPTWEQVLRFLPGVMRMHRFEGSAELWADALERDAERHPHRARVYGFLGAALADYSEVFRDEKRLRRVFTRARAAYHTAAREWPSEDLIFMLDHMARVAHPLVGHRWYEFGEPWVPVAAGRHVIGGDEQAIMGLPRTVVDVVPFSVSKRLVTVGDYELFVISGGSAPPDWAQQLRWPGRPVVKVNYTQATEYCAWATAERVHWSVPKGFNVDLPSEFEWEVVARDASALSYAGTSPAPVGAFPAHDANGVLDLIGNVWEWTRTHVTALGEEVSLDASQGTVIRGGWWFNDHRILRAANRYWVDRSAHLRFIGIRLVLRSTT